jgi:hypothetical protein
MGHRQEPGNKITCRGKGKDRRADILLQNMQEGQELTCFGPEEDTVIRIELHLLKSRVVHQANLSTWKPLTYDFY